LEKIVNRKHALLTVALLVFVAVCASGCGSSTDTPVQEGGESAALDETSIRFSWIHTIEYAGFYAAEADGYYAEEGLSVDLRGGGFDDDGNYLDPIPEVLDGEVDFGVMDAGVLMEVRAGGAPLVAVASIYQLHPLAFVSLAEKDISRPEDLIGASVDVADNSQVLFQALLNSQGIDPSTVNDVPRTDFTINTLVNGEIDVIEAWVTNEVVELALGGYEFNSILVSDYGIEVYPNVIFTTEEMIANNPDLVERFLRATLRGMQRVVDEPEYSGRLAVEYNEELDLEKETEASFQAVSLLNPGGSKPGMMSPKAWNATQDIMLEQGLLDGPIDVEGLYTLEFVERIYAEG
jgi:NitT/TauT family transport system substrate-binding protein